MAWPNWLTTWAVNCPPVPVKTPPLAGVIEMCVAMAATVIEAVPLNVSPLPSLIVAMKL